MVKRTISGVIGAALILAILFFNQNVPMIINLFISLVCILTTYEIYLAMGINKVFEILIPSLLFRRYFLFLDSE